MVIVFLRSLLFLGRKIDSFFIKLQMIYRRIFLVILFYLIFLGKSQCMVNGVVEVELDRSKERLNLKPGQRINYNTKRQNYRVEEVDTYKWCAWKDGKLIFRDEPLDDVFRKIGQVYNADIVVMDKDLAKHMYRATFQGETLDEILRLMKLTVPMKYIEKTSEKAMPNGVYSKRYIEVVRL